MGTRGFESIVGWLLAESERMLIIHVLSRPRRSFPPNSDKIVALVKASRRRMDLECARSPQETLYSLRTRLRANYDPSTSF